MILLHKTRNDPITFLWKMSLKLDQNQSFLNVRRETKPRHTLVFTSHLTQKWSPHESWTGELFSVLYFLNLCGSCLSSYFPAGAHGTYGLALNQRAKLDSVWGRAFALPSAVLHPGTLHIQQLLVPMPDVEAWRIMSQQPRLAEADPSARITTTSHFMRMK